jgi:hypothetical protein
VVLTNGPWLMGTVILKESRPHIEVNDSQQIEIVEGQGTR